MSDFDLTDAFPECARLELDEGVVARICYEQDSEHCDPRQWDNLGTMYIYRPGYSLGDEQLPESGLPEIDCPVCDGGERDVEGPVHLRESFGVMVEEEPTCPRCENSCTTEPTLTEWLREINAVAAMPLFIYEHSGMTISSGRFVWLADEDEMTREDTASHGRFIGDDAGWDTSFSGVIVATRENIENLGAPDDRESIERSLESEVSEYASWLEGDVYYYTVDGPHAPHDSCGGFIGFDHAKEEAKQAAEHAVERSKRERAEIAEWAARDVETVAA